jgi:hypothetical protein
MSSQLSPRSFLDIVELTSLLTYICSGSTYRMFALIVGIDNVRISHAVATKCLTVLTVHFERDRQPEQLRD